MSVPRRSTRDDDHAVAETTCYGDGVTTDNSLAVASEPGMAERAELGCEDGVADGFKLVGKFWFDNPNTDP